MLQAVKFRATKLQKLCVCAKRPYILYHNAPSSSSYLLEKRVECEFKCVFVIEFVTEECALLVASAPLGE